MSAEATEGWSIGVDSMRHSYSCTVVGLCSGVSLAGLKALFED